MKRHFTPVIILLACSESSTLKEQYDAQDMTIEMEQDANNNQKTDSNIEDSLKGIIYFSARTINDNYNGIYQFDLHTKKVQELTDKTGAIITFEENAQIKSPTFSQDHTKLIYEKKTPSTDNIELYDLATGELQIITQAKGYTSFAWQDESTIFFSEQSRKDNHFSTSIYKVDINNISLVEVLNMPLHDFRMNIDILQQENLLAFDCVPPQNLVNAAQNPDYSNTNEINYPRTLCTSQIPSSGRLNFLNNGNQTPELELVGLPIKWDDGGSINKIIGVYTPCKRTNENKHRLCAMDYTRTGSLFEVPLPEEYDITQFSISKDHNVILNLDYIWNRTENKFIPTGFKEGTQIGNKQIRNPIIIDGILE